MVILVTGGCGFIGSHLTDLLITNGHSVRIFDNLSTGKLTNIQQHENSSKFEFIEGDLRDEKILREVIKDVETIFHFGAQIDVRRSIRDPIYDADVNIQGSIQLTQIAVEDNVDWFVFASTGGAIYGNSPRLPADEATPTEPESPYGISKLSFEKYLQFFHQTYGIGTTCLRYANIYGPRQDPRGEAGVISIFLSQIMKNEALTIFGDGTQTRDYVFVDDAVKAAYTAYSNQANGIYNIGTGKETSVNELASIILETTQAQNNIIYLPERPGEVQRSCLESGLAKKRFNWQPKTSLKDGIDRTWAWLKKQDL
ncbi:MAG: NAD-dependent epimerase/dehydratase family protein [Candidatus Hodarchaeota archaeon]